MSQEPQKSTIHNIYVSWSSLAVTVPWDILPALSPQGHIRAASRTNIPIIDKAGGSQRQVLSFSLLLQLFQHLFWGFQAANAIPSASLSVHRSCCSLSSHHCCLLVKWETSEWHLCSSRARMETWQVCETPWVCGRTWVVTPKPTTIWTKGRVAKLMAEGSSQGTHSWSPLSCWRHLCITHLPSATDELEYHGCITCTHRTAVGSVSSTLAMNIPLIFSYSKLPFLSGWREKIKMVSKKTNLFFMDHGVLRISFSVVMTPVNRYQVKTPIIHW